MAYKPTTFEELAFMEDFRRHLPEIQAFRAKYPKESLEGAYQKVTGRGWMPGRSIKEHNGQYEMTKDRTVGSVLGKYVAPIGAGTLAALTMGGALPAVSGLLGAGGAGASAGAPAATEAGIFGTAAANGALGTVGSLAGAGSTIGKVANILNAGGKAIGAATTAAGQNRFDADDAAARAAHQNIVDKATQEAADAAQRALDRKTLYKASVAKTPQVSPYNTKGVPALSPELLSGLSDMEKEALARLRTPQAAYTPYTPKRPSTLEQVGNYASPVASTIGTIARYL